MALSKSTCISFPPFDEGGRKRDISPNFGLNRDLVDFIVFMSIIYWGAKVMHISKKSIYMTMNHFVWAKICSMTSVDDPDQENQSDIDRICLIEFYCPSMEIRISFKRTHRSQQNVMKLVETNLRMTSNKMPLSEIRMPRLTTEQRLWALGILESGSGQVTVARHFGVQQSTISRLWNHFHLHGTVNDGPRSGRPRITTRNQDRYIRIQHLRDRFRTATLKAVASVGLHNRPLSWWTIRRRLHEGSLQVHRPFRGPVLSQEIRQNRLPWAR